MRREMGAVIETSGLAKSYGKSRGIRGVDLTVREGEVFGFLGPNGAGKTTTIRLLMGFLRPSGGSARVFGFDVWRQSVEVRSRVGNLPGEFALEDRLTGEELLRFFARLRGVGDLSHARELAERLGAELGRPMRRLSRGNKQKIGLIQAMFHRPPLLILDEPTGGLDPLVQEEFLGMVREVKEEGRTVFFSSHNLAEVERVCDRVGIIREGELVAVEPTDALIDKSFRHVRVAFGEEPPEKELRRLAGLPGVENFRSEGPGRVSFTVYGGFDAVIKQLARHTVAGVDFERPSLEEVFLAYYGGKGDGR
ncbi:ABC transporter related [Rubrobacter xylanophilus DSM 9941]|uniref:ABC transporter related n=2 Tax=Rubrobacter xylanophilus TaxID=49319 RepID=Q1AZV9_RUBXD|nr:ABC transporter related [Rubrobacter xylanophilus DSM 9941]